MTHMWYVWFPIIMLFIILYLQRKQRRKIVASQQIMNQKIMKHKIMKEKDIMKELAERFIGKDCYINMLEGNVDGTIKEVTDGGIVLDKDGNLNVINLDYVVRIREYPYKNGKRATFIGD